MISLTFRFVAVADDVNLTSSRYKTLPCYLAIFILAEVFEMLMAFDALRLRNVIQLFGILFEPFLIVSPIMIALSWFALMWFVRELYHEFGWAIFHVVGANPAMKTMYQYYQIMVCLLKLDFFVFVGVTMQLLILVLDDETAEFGLTVAAIPVTMILLIMAGYAVQREIKSLMTISLILMLAAQTYFFKLYRFYSPASEATYLSTRATLTTFTIVASLLLFATFGIGCKCFHDFDKGLQSSKMHGQYYKPVATQLKETLLGERFMADPKSSYTSGGPMDSRRLSIE
ncbi:uncharacterized protein B0H18DRAFT_978061 [Fomitopsis serialis]|uniref:uncharacterized protein n=1 Tax=Fomitopsis serialis TaxID=139415 RepID=UPI00200772B9|nr:uncharacterized protein B0H18DRAFT_978061 [Neoantrodia serialis]KAH9934754.1 hypothetical protein B0H18DRAFT_978061 [Neoantrodia serialis]